MLLAISPAETVEFDMVSKRQAFVKVSNPNDFACAFKVLVTAPQRYRVKPATGVVAAGAAVEVHLTLTATELVPEKEWARDKFQFRMARFNEHSGASFWQHVADEDIEQTKLRCRHLSNGVSSAGAQREEKQEERPFRKGFASPPPSLDQPIREASPPAEATGEVTRGGESCSLEENSAEEVEQPRPLSLDAREGDSSQRAQAEATANAETLAAEAERGAAAAAAAAAATATAATAATAAAAAAAAAAATAATAAVATAAMAPIDEDEPEPLHETAAIDRQADHSAKAEATIQTHREAPPPPRTPHPGRVRDTDGWGRERGRDRSSCSPRSHRRRSPHRCRPHCRRLH